MGHKHICLPFASEAQYRAYVDDPAQYRQYLTQIRSQHPELFPKSMDQGFTLHDCYASGGAWATRVCQLSRAGGSEMRQERSLRSCVAAASSRT